MRPGRRSWEHVYAGLSDMISPAARSSWRKLLFQHQLRRLAEIPMVSEWVIGICFKPAIFSAKVHVLVCWPAKTPVTTIHAPRFQTVEEVNKLICG